MNISDYNIHKCEFLKKIEFVYIVFKLIVDKGYDVWYNIRVAKK